MLCLARIVLGVLRITGITALALVLTFCLWLEVIAGSGNAWDYVQPGNTNPGAATAWFGFAVLGPAVMVVTTIRSRRRPYGLTDRALHVETWGLIIAIPLALVAFVIFAAGAII
jgi:hypothetical protein